MLKQLSKAAQSSQLLFRNKSWALVTMKANRACCCNFSTSLMNSSSKDIQGNNVPSPDDERAFSKEYEEILRKALFEYLKGESEFDLNEDDLGRFTKEWSGNMFKDEYERQLYEEQAKEAERRGVPFGKDSQTNENTSTKASNTTIPIVTPNVSAPSASEIPTLQQNRNKDTTHETQKQNKEYYSITVSPEHDNMRLDRFLSKTLAINFGLLQKVIRKKHLLKNDSIVKEHNERVFSGDKLRIAKEYVSSEKKEEIEINRTKNVSQPSKVEKFNKTTRNETVPMMEKDEEMDSISSLLLGEPIYKKQGRKLKLQLTEEQVEEIRSWVLFKNDEIIAINKPYGICVQGGTDQNFHIDAILDALTMDGFVTRPKLVHRLDRDTTGVLIVARNRPGAIRMQEWFNDTQIPLKKCYWAITTGAPTPTAGRIKMALDIQKDETGFEKVMPVDAKEVGAGRMSITEYKTIDHMTDKMAWLALYPVTGRKHQLRVHCATGIGCPILGDFKYGQGVPESLTHVLPEVCMKRLHLHHRAMILPYLDSKGANIIVTAPLPEHFQGLFSFLMLNEKKGNKLLFK
ncbi:hypothetical protein C9374_007321 [Naegleria lovaniensis]|uniref:Pseudouridine synthase RsuA/RluA-like domain-containing protein n=1 Tax=Naegleria lovaniensis TaxID=51637 RepID=A0AA88KGG0_NAELO|nr:uncharacterized protein C9374_007321 [Naegleria lovaniensis]KAG2379182.1 hypothetical protein C9374_007321 [Naegleria lovaniensis]